MTWLLKRIDRARRARKWERQWSDPTFAPGWELQGVPIELAEAIETGWLPRHGHALDIGCGRGRTTAWLAERGYTTTGIDVSDTAVRTAQALHAHLAPRVEFRRADVSVAPLTTGRYSVLIDRGCFHGLSPRVVPDYVANIRAAAAPDARMLLFIRAFRDGRPMGDQQEVLRLAGKVRDAFSGRFSLERYACTSLNHEAERQGRDPRPGMVFWLRVLPQRQR